MCMLIVLIAQDQSQEFIAAAIGMLQVRASGWHAKWTDWACPMTQGALTPAPGVAPEALCWFVMLTSASWSTRPVVIHYSHVIHPSSNNAPIVSFVTHQNPFSHYLHDYIIISHICMLSTSFLLLTSAEAAILKMAAISSVCNVWSSKGYCSLKMFTTQLMSCSHCSYCVYTGVRLINNNKGVLKKMWPRRKLEEMFIVSTSRVSA